MTDRTSKVSIHDLVNDSDESAVPPMSNTPLPPVQSLHAGPVPSTYSLSPQFNGPVLPRMTTPTQQFPAFQNFQPVYYGYYPQQQPLEHFQHQHFQFQQFAPPQHQQPLGHPVEVQSSRPKLVPLKLAKRPKSRNRQEKKTTRQQGRPFTTGLNGRFLLHDTFESLFLHLEKKDRRSIRFYDLSATPDAEIPHHTDVSIEHLDQFQETRFDYPSEVIDSILGRIGQDIVLKPVDTTVTTKTLKVETENTSDMRLVEDVVPGEHGTGFTEILRDSDNVLPFITRAFEVDELTFVRIIRDYTGKMVKLQTVPYDELAVNSEWIKRQVCHPRYKSRMKIHMIKGRYEFGQILYNDLRMLISDLQENKDLDNEYVSLARCKVFVNKNFN